MSARQEQSAAPLRVGLVGLGGWAGRTVRHLALGGAGDLKVVAVADQNKELAEETAARLGARPYTDVRSLLVESAIEAVLMSLPHQCYPEYCRLAAERGLHLLKEKPLGRSFGEGLAIERAYRDAGRVCMIGTQRRFEPPFARLKERLAEVGRPFLFRSHFLFNWSGEFRWRGDRGRGGFGVLGDAGYHNIDLANWLFGPPEEVYSIQAGAGRTRAGQPYDTDDTAVCVLRYASGLIGTITCSWATAKLSGSPIDLTVHGTEGVLAAATDRFERFNLAGEPVERLDVPLEQSESEALAGKLAAFAAAVRAGKADYPCSARQNLLNQAVVEAAYLSGRTGQPEQPAKIFELSGLAIDEFLAAPANPTRA